MAFCNKMEYPITELDIQKELKISERNYSEFRSPNNKWVQDKQLLFKYTGNRPEIENSSTLWSYESLLRRTSLKRSEKIFGMILNLWKLINPLNLPGISQQMYTKVYECLYASFLRRECDGQFISKCVGQDLTADLKNEPFLRFSDFYDGFFQYVDKFTASLLVSEYYRFVKSCYECIESPGNMGTLQRFSRLHLKSNSKYVHPYWMIAYLKPRDTHTGGEYLKKPKFKSFSNTQSNRLLNRSTKTKEREHDVEIRRIHKLIQLAQRDVTRKNPRYMLRKKYESTQQFKDSPKKVNTQKSLPRIPNRTHTVENIIEGKRALELEYSANH